MIDCPAEKVTAWRESEGLFDDRDLVRFFWFPNDDSTFVRRGSGNETWTRTTQGLKKMGRPAVRELWEAPPEAAISIIQAGETAPNECRRVSKAAAS